MSKNNISRQNPSFFEFFHLNRQMCFSYAIVVLSILSLTTPASADCIRPKDCQVFWVAAQKTGMPLSYFSQVLPPTDAREIAIGDNIVSDLAINLREQAANLDSRGGVLPKGTVVVVEDIKRIQRKQKGDQIWLKVSVNKDEYAPAGGTSVKVSLSGNQLAPEKKDDASERPTLSPTARKINECYNKLAQSNKTVTIDDMQECSGQWVSPRALILCSIGANCPSLADNLEGRATFDAILKQSNLTPTSSLQIDPHMIPRLPPAEVIQNCKKNSQSDENDFLSCASSGVTSQYAKVVDCFNKFTDGERLACFSREANNETFTKLVGCLAGGRPSPDKIALCANKEVEEKSNKLRDCISKAAADATRACLTDQLPPAVRSAADCFRSVGGAGNPASCFDQISPDMAKARKIAECLRQSSDTQVKAMCLTPMVGGDTLKLTQCLSKDSALDTAICLSGDKPEVRAAQRIYTCVAKGRDATSIITNCADGVLDTKSRQTVACLTRAGSDRSRLASCAAGSVLPPEAARLVGCATNSQGPTAFAICAAGPAMNEEWRIAAECAVQSGGEPVSFVSCTGGRLTIRELTKCIAGEIGKDCFGPNNTIVVAYKNAFHDLTQGPGENNEVVVAIRKIGEFVGGGPNSFVRNPSQIWGGSNSVFNNPKQIFGGDHSVFNDPGQVFNPGRWRF